MNFFAGTSRGVFRVVDGCATRILDCGGVREVVRLEGSLFAGTGKGLYVSEDGGISWILTNLRDLAVWQIRQSTQGTLYAGTAPTALYRSEDGGYTWTEIESLSRLAKDKEWRIPVDPPIPAAARALVVKGDRLWVGVEVGGIAISQDAGETWSVVLPGDNPDLHMIFPHPRHEEKLFASTGYGRLNGVADMIEGNAGIFRSDDGGDSWVYTWRGITPRYSRPMCIDHRAPFSLTVASAPTAFSNYRQEGGAQAMLFRSEDCGESWYSLCDQDHSPSHANFHGLAVDPFVLGGVLVGTDNGEVWRVNGQAEWCLLATGMPAVVSISCE
ncbi:MAG: WD40/YVTN/BNR-like repeat-containing protein [Candidatus Azotimanducaceae bacterium]|uniref:Exo-alpha-sialidase n=1 Tax=OM182 bacterium TaxID=2510334 RepID=A0A520RY22_9GAMM|nr:hypothetical protein [Gammaproteobacteria bacterium]RZO75075.1 MAG: exo-alpha-sialidase [OM182 bacterium]